ncbi:MAG TPA: type IX secretion system membrane protein PorP/SprF, partial [Elusimicrobiota bacterium]|nr:type IX secretion system membrane protein PorP/SprF [Elusimicrobiota bacterium]
MNPLTAFINFIFDNAVKMNRVLALSIFAAAILQSNVLASFEPLSVGARAAGMADAYTVVSDDALSLYYNPAGLVHVKRPELSAFYSQIFMGLDDKSSINRQFLGYAHPLQNNLGTVGVGYVNLGLSGGLYSEDTFSVSYARELGSRWNVGGSAKMLKKSFGSDLYTENAINPETGFAKGGRDPLFDKGTSKSALAIDLGTQFRLTKHYGVGLALRNINSPNMAIGDDEDKAPAVYALGLARWTRVSSLSIDVSECKFMDGYDFRLALSGERWFRSGLGVRAGLATGSREYRTLAVGGSYRMDGFQFDYALNYPLQGIEKTAGTHMVSITFRFGKPALDPIEEQLKIEREARLRAEAELARLRQQLMQMTTVEPSKPADTGMVDTAAQEALRQADEELRRLKEQEAQVMAMPMPEAPVAAVAPVATPAKPAVVQPTVPAKPKVTPELLAQYSDALKFYSQQVKEGADVSERIATLKRTLQKFEGKLDVSVTRSELKKLESQSSAGNAEFEIAANYYKKIVQQGISQEERIILLERIIKKYKPLGTDVSGFEKEL